MLGLDRRVFVLFEEKQISVKKTPTMPKVAVSQFKKKCEGVACWFCLAVGADALS